MSFTPTVLVLNKVVLVLESAWKTSGNTTSTIISNPQFSVILFLSGAVQLQSRIAKPFRKTNTARAFSVFAESIDVLVAG